ncbi:hypothetical protein HDV05_002196, partial [Chytridiales sp. JEL 0842]
AQAAACILNPKHPIVQPNFDYLMAMSPTYFASILSWAFARTLTWQHLTSIMWGTTGALTLIPPALILLYDPVRNLKENYIFAMKAYFFTISQTLIAGLLVSYLLHVSNSTIRRLNLSQISEAVTNINVIASFLYVSFAFPILKVLIIRLHFVNPGLHTEQVDYKEAIVKK